MRIGGVGVPLTFMGEGESRPLLRLMILRSTVNACGMLNQKSSSRATRSAGRPDTAAAADWARAMASLWKAARTVAAEEKKRRRCIEQANRVSVQNSNPSRDSNGPVLLRRSPHEPNPALTPPPPNAHNLS